MRGVLFVCVIQYVIQIVVQVIVRSTVCFNLLDHAKPLREANSLVKVTAYKRSRRDPSEAAMQDVNALIFQAMAKENPRLYEEVRRFLNSKKDEIADSTGQG